MMSIKSFVFRFADAEVREREFSVIKAGETVPVEPKAFRVLLILLRNPKKLIAKEELLTAVWGDVAVTDNSLTRSIALLRRLLGDDARDPRFIETVATVGYRFLRAVEVSEEGPSELAPADTPITHGAQNSNAGIATPAVDWSVSADSPESKLAPSEKAAEAAPHMPASAPSRELSGKTIAVLPFVNLSPENDSSYFADGLTEELMHALTSIRELRVVARTSAFQFRNSSQDIRQIGRALNAELLLEGSVRLAGDQLRITARLATASDGIQLWSGRYDRKLEQIFQIQDEISGAIAATVKQTLAPSSLLPLHPPPPRTDAESDLEAMKLYLRGRHFWNQRTAIGFRKAVACFQQAIDRQPRFGRAHAGLADVYVMMMMHNLARPTELMPKARKAASTALQIDPTSAQAHCSLASVHGLFDWNWAAAEVEFQRSIDADPNYATVYHWRSLIYDTAQNQPDRALADIRKAEQLDPLSVPIANDIGFMHYFFRRFEQADSQCQAALEINPNFYRIHILLGRIHAVKQRYRESIECLDHALRTMDGDAFRSQALGTLGFVYGRLGDREKSARIATELEVLGKRAFASPVDWAILAAGAGDLEGALRHLSDAACEKAGFLVMLGREPLLDSLRQDSRFAALLQQVVKDGHSVAHPDGP
jgi:adenylate cyclase